MGKRRQSADIQTLIPCKRDMQSRNAQILLSIDSMIALLVVPPLVSSRFIYFSNRFLSRQNGRVKYFDRGEKKKKKSLNTLAGFNGSRNQWKRGKHKSSFQVISREGDKFNSRFIELIDLAISSCLIIPVQGNGRVYLLYSPILNAFRNLAFPDYF